MTARSIDLQHSSRLDPDATFAYAVGPRTPTFGGEQPGYVALYVGGHNGVRLSLDPQQARDLAELLRLVAEEVGEADGPPHPISEVILTAEVLA